MQIEDFKGVQFQNQHIGILISLARDEMYVDTYRVDNAITVSVFFFSLI